MTWSSSLARISNALQRYCKHSSKSFATSSSLPFLLANQESQIVLLSQVLSHSCNIGYETNRNLRLLKCNDHSITNLSQLQKIVATMNGTGTLSFEFSTGQIMIMNAAAALDSNKQVNCSFKDVHINFIDKCVL